MPPPPPPPPPPGPPPPSSCAPPAISKKTEQSRGAMLSDINKGGFKLKKTGGIAKDASKPLLGNESGSNNSKYNTVSPPVMKNLLNGPKLGHSTLGHSGTKIANGPPGLGDLFSGGVPRLRGSSNNDNRTAFRPPNSRYNIEPGPPSGRICPPTPVMPPPPLSPAGKPNYNHSDSNSNGRNSFPPPPPDMSHKPLPPPPISYQSRAPPQLPSTIRAPPPPQRDFSTLPTPSTPSNPTKFSVPPPPPISNVPSRSTVPPPPPRIQNGSATSLNGPPPPPPPIKCLPPGRPQESWSNNNIENSKNGFSHIEVCEYNFKFEKDFPPPERFISSKHEYPSMESKPNSGRVKNILS